MRDEWGWIRFVAYVGRHRGKGMSTNADYVPRHAKG